MGGAHAIAAFAFGTETVPKVDRIVGPGQHLCGRGQEAARRRSRHRLRRRSHGDPHHCRRWRPAHPGGRHAGPGGARCGRFGHPADDVERAGRAPWRPRWTRQLQTLADRAGRARAIAAQQRHRPGSRRSRKRIESRQPLRARAPQHPRRARCSARSANAGSVFIGPYSPEAAGDYASGPNHVLPTSGPRACAAGSPPPISSR